jgi:ABC-type enterobactin transport system permease subunit
MFMHKKQDYGRRCTQIDIFISSVFSVASVADFFTLNWARRTRIPRIQTAIWSGASLRVPGVLFRKLRMSPGLSRA